MPHRSFHLYGFGMTKSGITDGLRFPLLDVPVFTVTGPEFPESTQLTLPEVLAALSRDAITVFSALRPHQRHVWHAFLTQVATLALLKDERSTLPVEASKWRALLLGLTPQHPDGAAWALVSPLDRPAFLQAPEPSNSIKVLKKQVPTPDALDVLVTSTNHDVKRTIMESATPEHWAYALVSLQTQEGYSGNTLYGISRMNGGWGSRPGVGVVPPGGLGARFKRDVLRLLELRPRLLETYPYPSGGGVGLVWLSAWDGATSLRPPDLDLYYIEICRRARLVEDDGVLRARTVGSKVPRIDAKGLAGDSGDPWTPLVPDGDGRKALTVSVEGLVYHRVVPILFPDSSPTAIRPSPLQEVAPSDPVDGLSILARVLVRTDKGTEGYHERLVPVSRAVRQGFGPKQATDEMAALAAARVADAGTLATKVVYAAALTAFIAAPSAGERARDDNTAKARAGTATLRFQELVDGVFFTRFNEAVKTIADASDTVAARREVRWSWILELRTLGQSVLADVLSVAPTGAMRRDRTRVRAERRFASAFARYFAEHNPATAAPPTADLSIVGAAPTGAATSAQA